jgi:hypothetical protein
VTLDEVSPGLWLGIGGTTLALAGAATGYAFWRRYRARRVLQERVASVALENLQDVILPDGNGGWFHVDFLLLTQSGVLVVDLRDVPGLLFGSEQMTEWTVMQKTRRFTFPNPLGPLYDRIAVVRQIAGDGVPVEGRVVFTDRGNFPKGHPPHVTRLASLPGEFPMPDREFARLAAARFQDGWKRLREAASPSPLRRN